MTARASLILCAACLAGGCDDSQAWHEPDFSLGRMQEQPRLDPFDEGMASPPPFTVAHRTRDTGGSARLTRADVERGRDRFDVLCATCHGVRGDGDSVVATKMLFVRPPSLLEPRIRGLSDAQIGAVIVHGYGLMPSYANELAGSDRAATVAYVRALQIAQGVSVSALPAPLAAALAREAP